MYVWEVQVLCVDWFLSEYYLFRLVIDIFSWLKIPYSSVGLPIHRPLAKESEGLEFKRKKKNSKASLISSLLIDTV